MPACDLVNRVIFGGEDYLRVGRIAQGDAS